MRYHWCYRQNNDLMQKYSAKNSNSGAYERKQQELTFCSLQFFIKNKNKDATAHLICMCSYGKITLILFSSATLTPLLDCPNANIDTMPQLTKVSKCNFPRLIFKVILISCHTPPPTQSHSILSKMNRHIFSCRHLVRPILYRIFQFQNFLCIFSSRKCSN